MTHHAVLHHPAQRNELTERANALAIQNPDIIVIGGVEQVPQEFDHLSNAGYQLLPSAKNVSLADLEKHAAGTSKVVVGLNVA